MKIFTYLCAIILIFLGISFSLLNSTEVSINYFIGSSVLPTSFLVIISAAIGAMICLFFCLLSVLRGKATIFSLKRKIESLEKTIQSSSVISKE